MDESGTAFPSIEQTYIAGENGEVHPHMKAHHPGMSLRQWYAAKAMQAVLPQLLSSQATLKTEGIASPMSDEELLHACSEVSFQMADAMIRAGHA